PLYLSVIVPTIHLLPNSSLFPYTTLFRSKLKALVLDSVSSPITKRVYNMALDEFLLWFQQAPRPGFTKATVSAWRVSLEARGLRSEEHTSELQSPYDLVCRLLLEKKKKSS